MRKRAFKSFVWVALGLIVLLGSTGCPAQPPVRPKPAGEMVILSHLGEVTSDSRYVGQTIRYRIYYRNLSRRKSTIRISDELDPGLSDVVAFDGGSYDGHRHAVSWVIADVPAGKQEYVEFQAVIGETDRVRNQASIQSTRWRTHKTEILETQVYPLPRLGWIPFDGVSEEGAAPRAYMKDETTMGTMVNIDVPGMFVHQLDVDGVPYHRLSIPGYSTLLDLGKPALPIVGQLVEVPHGANLSIEIVKSESVPLERYNVYPAQEREARQAGSKPEGFAIDETTYLANAVYPGDLASFQAEDVGIVRGHRLVFLKVNPLQYNPATGVLSAYSNVEVRLNYDRPAQIEPADVRLESPAFEGLLRAAVLNHKDSGRFSRDISSSGDEGCDYLVITHSRFYDPSKPDNPIVRLQDWKQRKGYVTKVVTTADITDGDTSAGIRDYIEDAYNQWSPAPTYVLLVGDADLVRTDYRTNHPDHNNTPIGTDLYYAAVDGTDYFPDLFIGRLSVDTLAQAETVVDKLLDYEQDPPPNPGYYEDTSLVCLFEDDTDRPGDTCREDGQEDCSFRIIEFAEEIRDYLDGQDYDPERIYARTGAWPQGPQRYEDGTNLPAGLTLAGGFGWNGTPADITAAIDNGSFIVTFDGHGSRTGWGDPGFDLGDVAGLANGRRTPVVFSFTCQTGWFDNETDATDIDPAPGIQGTANGDESFCERLLRRGNGGAAAVIGSTRNSWENNDFLMLGVYKAIWPDFDPGPPLDTGQVPEIGSSPLVRMGQINTFGKVYMAKRYTHDFQRQSSFEMYTLFGDPEMPVWTEEPARLRVEFPQGIGATGQQDFVVKVTDDGSGDPVRSATAVLTRDGAILAVRQTNPAGIARFTLTALGSGDTDLTVTAHNYRPFLDAIEVNSGGAELNRLDPENGMPAQTFHVGGQGFSGGESIDLYFGSLLARTVPAAGGEFGQAGVEDVDIPVPSPHPLGPVNVLAHGKTSDRYAVDVFQVRSANPVDLYTYSQWDSSTWHLHPGDNATWDNPEIQLYDSGGNPVASNNLVVGDTYTIEAQIHNDTDHDADNVQVTFKWANFGVGQPERVWEEIEVAEIDVPAHDVEEAVIEWAPPSTGHLCIIAEIYHIEDVNDGNNKGQENLHIGPTSSPAQVAFEVWNPTAEPAAVYLELRQLETSSPEQEQRLWASWIKHPDPQIIPPGERREAWVIVDPDPSGARPGDQAVFALTGYINGRMIGGINLTITKR